MFQQISSIILLYVPENFKFSIYYLKETSTYQSSSKFQTFTYIRSSLNCIPENSKGSLTCVPDFKLCLTCVPSSNFQTFSCLCLVRSRMFKSFLACVLKAFPLYYRKSIFFTHMCYIKAFLTVLHLISSYIFQFSGIWNISNFFNNNELTFYNISLDVRLQR